jgi:UDP-N-acetylmuramate--alanine ligase
MAEPISLGYDALREKYPDKKIIVCFQPHQLRRIVVERDAFVASLSHYDAVYIYNIYAAREKPEDYKNFEGFASL